MRMLFRLSLITITLLGITVFIFSFVDVREHHYSVSEMVLSKLVPGSIMAMRYSVDSYILAAFIPLIFYVILFLLILVPYKLYISKK